MKFTTSITKIENDEEYIRGISLGKLIKEQSFVATVFLLLKGQLPNDSELKMMNALFTAAIDHGPGTASAMTARIVASAKNSLHTAVAAGILAMGERHGSAIEGAAKFFQEQKNNPNLEEVVKKLKEQKVRLPGYGHALLEVDHRAGTLLLIARENNFYGECCVVAEKTGEILNSISSKKLPLNVDAAMAAILSDMGFEWQIMKGFFIIARVPGLVAQAYEEISNDTGLKRLSEDAIEYV